MEKRPKVNRKVIWGLFVPAIVTTVGLILMVASFFVSSPNSELLKDIAMWFMMFTFGWNSRDIKAMKEESEKRKLSEGINNG